MSSKVSSHMPTKYWRASTVPLICTRIPVFDPSLPRPARLSSGPSVKVTFFSVAGCMPSFIQRWNIACTLHTRAHLPEPTRRLIDLVCPVLLQGYYSCDTSTLGPSISLRNPLLHRLVVLDSYILLLSPHNVSLPCESFRPSCSLLTSCSHGLRQCCFLGSQYSLQPLLSPARFLRLSHIAGRVTSARV